MNIRLAPHAAASRLAADFRTDIQPVDLELADMDVEPGKDRSLLRGRFQLGEPDERDPIGGHAVDVELVVEPCTGTPVELDVGRRQEHSALIGDGDVPQLRFAEDGSVDPADMDAQAG